LKAGRNAIAAQGGERIHPVLTMPTFPAGERWQAKSCSEAILCGQEQTRL